METRFPGEGVSSANPKIMTLKLLALPFLGVHFYINRAITLTSAPQWPPDDGESDQPGDGPDEHGEEPHEVGAGGHGSG